MVKLNFWDRLSMWWSRNVKNRIYWLKCRLFKKYNHVRIRTLPCTWTDRDRVLVHAMFQVLTDFMEKEKPGDVTDWDWNPEHAHAWKEITELYDWWHNVYLKFDAWEEISSKDEVEPKIKFFPLENGLHRTTFEWESDEAEAEWRSIHKQRQDAEDAMEKQLEENCIRLIKIRGYLWT